MKNNTSTSRHPLRTAPARRVLLTSIASLLAAHAGFAGEAVFSSGAITGDADSGVNIAKTYTALANIIGGDVTTSGANGVTFIGSGTIEPASLSGTGWALSDVGNQFGGGGNHTTTFGGSVIDDLFDGFQYNGNPGTLTMSDLTPGQTYVVTLYNQAWGLGANRTQTVTSTDGASIVYNEDALEASVLRYTFVATGTTTELNFAINNPNAASMHFYGVSNEQVFTGNVWSPTSGNSWDTPANWSTSVQNGAGTNATFSAQAGPTPVTVDSATTIGHIEILGSGGYTFSGANTLTFQADAGGASVVKADAASHTVATDVQFNSAVAKFGAGSVRFTGAVAGTGKGLTVGSGALVFETATADLSSVGNITNDGALSVINAAAQSYGGAIGGTGGLAKSGAGTLTLGAASTYSGPTTISDGTLLLSPTIFLTIANPGFEAFDPLAGGSYGYSPTGASWTFGGNSGINLNGGPFFNPTNHEGIAGGFIQDTGGGISQTITVTDAGPYTFSFQGVSRAGAGPNGIVFEVDGTTVRSIAPAEFSEAAWQNYSATVTLSAGTHTISFVGNNVLGGDRSSAVDAVTGAKGGLLPSGTAVSLTNAGAALDLSGNDQTIGSLAGVAGTNIQNIGAFTVGGDGSPTAFAGVISGAGSFTKVGGGVLTLGGANIYGGSTTINAGTVRTAGGSLPANTALSLTSATSVFDMAGTSHTLGSLSGAAGSSVLGGGSITVGNNDASTTFAGNITGVGDLTKEGNGTLNLSGGTGNDYSGNTTVSGGTLRSDTPNAGTTGLATIAGGATWDLGSASHTVIGLTGNGTITRSGSLSTGADGAALLDSNFNKNYLLKLDFGGGGNGGANVNGVQFDDITSTSGANWSLVGAGNQYGEGNLSGLHTGYDQLVDDFYYNGNPGTLTFSNLTPGQTYGATLYTKVGHWPGRPQNATFDEDPDGPVATQLLGTDPGGIGYYAYKFVAHANKMSISMTPQIGHTFHWFAATLEGLSATTPTLTIGDSNNYTFGGVINGPTKLIKQGIGAQHLYGASNYSGGTDIADGVIFAHHSAALGSGPVSIASDANYLAWWNTGSPVIKNSFILNGPGGDAGDGLKDAIYADGGGAGYPGYVIAGSVTLNATSNVGGNNDNDLVLLGQVTGAGGLTKGAGRPDENNTLLLSSSANDYAGDTVINKGSVKLGGSEVIPDGAGKGIVVVNTGTTLDLGGYSETINQLSGTGTITTTPSVTFGAPVFFTDDAGTGISGAKTYTHALDFVDAGPLTINTVPFTSAGLSGANWSLTGAGSIAGSGATGATGDISTLLTNFYYNGNPATLTLTGLTPGQSYETHLFQRKWGGDRTQLFVGQTGAAAGVVLFDEDGSATPSYLPMRYTADASGAATISTFQVGDGTYHWFGVTNEEVAAPDRPVLTVGDATDSTFSGTITGELEIDKVGAGILTLDGTLTFPQLTVTDGQLRLDSPLDNATIDADGGILVVNASLTDTTVNVGATNSTYFTTDQTLTDLNIADGGYAEVTDPPAPAEIALLAEAPAQTVPEPGSAALLLGGLLTLMGLRRRNA